jgi:hypothetical protein
MIISYKGFKQLRTGAYWLAGLILLANAVSIYLYYRTFHGPLSKNSADWANFGGYLSGTLGISVSAMALVGVTYFTIKVGRASQQQFLTTLRAPAYKEMIAELYKVRADTYRIGTNLENFKVWIDNIDFNNLMFLRGDQVTLFENLRVQLLKDFDPLLQPHTPQTDWPGLFKQFDQSKKKLITYLMYVMKETNN